METSARKCPRVPARLSCRVPAAAVGSEHRRQGQQSFATPRVSGMSSYLLRGVLLGFLASRREQRPLEKVGMQIVHTPENERVASYSTAWM